MIWTFILRLPSRYLIAGVLLSFAAYGFLSRDLVWRSELIRAISAAGLPLVVTGPVLSGVAGYETWQWRRRLQALASGLPTPSAIASAPWWGVAGTGLIVQSVAIAAHAVTAVATGAVVGTWTFWPIVIQLAGICGYTALGALIGWHVPSPVVAPAVSIALIGANVLGPAAGVPVRALTDVGLEGMDFIGITFNPTFMGLQAACFLGLTAAAALPRKLPQTARALTQTTAVAIAAAAGAGLLLAAPTRIVPDEAMPVACTSEHGLTVCSPAVWPEEHRRQLITALGEGITALNQLGVTGTPQQFEVETPATRLDRGVGLLPIDRTGMANRETRIAAVIALTSAAACFDIHNQQAAKPTIGELNARSVLGNLLSRMIGATQQGGPDPALTGINAMPNDQRTAWIQHAYTQVWACDPNVDLPDSVKRTAAPQ